MFFFEKKNQKTSVPGCIATVVDPLAAEPA